MKRRIFIALDLPTGLKENIAEAIKQWQWLPIRWLKPEHWHVTLIPPVYLEDAEREALVAHFKKIRWGQTFPLRFSRITLAPPGVLARMVWLEGETPRELGALKGKLERLWASRPELPQPKVESRPLRLHLTLARFEPGELKELEQKTRMLGEIDFKFEVKEVAIVESLLKPSGAEYDTLAVIPLAT